MKRSPPFGKDFQKETDAEAGKKPLFQRIYAAVRALPEGRVATYGGIGQYIGCSAQMVGFAMAAVAEESDVPWHRVINHKGMISRRADGYSDGRQRALLEAEGIRFDANGCLDLKRYGWRFMRLP